VNQPSLWALTRPGSMERRIRSVSIGDWFLGWSCASVIRTGCYHEVVVIAISGFFVAS
jgi:hypothetical protein